MNVEQFVATIFRIAGEKYKVEKSKRVGKQIDFGIKKLHEGHIKRLYQEGILKARVEEISGLIDKVAPGRPCVHRPLKEILDTLKRGQLLTL